MAEWDWRVSWWLFWRVFRVLESSARKDVSKLQVNGVCNTVLRKRSVFGTGWWETYSSANSRPRASAGLGLVGGWREIH